MAITKLSELLFRDCAAVGVVQIHQLFGEVAGDFLDLLQSCSLDRRCGFTPLLATPAPL